MHSHNYRPRVARAGQNGRSNPTGLPVLKRRVFALFVVSLGITLFLAWEPSIQAQWPSATTFLPVIAEFKSPISPIQTPTPLPERSITHLPIILRLWRPWFDGQYVGTSSLGATLSLRVMQGGFQASDGFFEGLCSNPSTGTVLYRQHAFTEDVQSPDGNQLIFTEVRGPILTIYQLECQSVLPGETLRPDPVCMFSYTYGDTVSNPLVSCETEWVPMHRQ
jgi:hypothetical protein